MRFVIPSPKSQVTAVIIDPTRNPNLDPYLLHSDSPSNCDSPPKRRLLVMDWDQMRDQPDLEHLFRFLIHGDDARQGD
jgi:hypothetical protein